MKGRSTEHPLAAQALASIGVKLFLIAHECGHYALEHGSTRESSQELAADRYAWDTLMAIAKAFHGNDQESNNFYDLIFAASAVAPLWYERQSHAWSSSVGLGDEAADALLESQISQIEKLADDLDLSVSPLMPEPYSAWAIQPEKVVLERIPMLLLVGGTRVDSQEIKDGTLRMSPSSTYLLATDLNGIACEKSYGDGQEVDLKFKPRVNATTEQIAQYRQARKWCDLIAVTADPQLHPRSSALSADLNEALFFVDAAIFIDPSLTSSDTDRRTAERRRRLGIGLSGWGFR